MLQTKLITKNLTKWWVPLCFWAITFLLYNIGELAQINSIRSFSPVLLFLGLILLFISSIRLFFQKKLLVAIISIVACVGSIAFLTIVSFIMYVGQIIDGDKWADNLKIPDNIPLNKPIDPTSKGFAPDRIVRTQTDFQLYNSFQPGLYSYDFWTPKIEAGTIYLKAFEITQNYPLSTRTLTKSTRLAIHNPSDTIARIGMKGDHFTIYEGDWGKPYAARFEVWFNPEEGEERKLLEKSYIIEGWMH